MDQYYEEILLEIAKMLERKQYKEVYDLLEDEFKMPYIPLESETKMIEIYNDVRVRVNQEKSKQMDDETLEEILHSNLEGAMQVVTYMKEHNIRKYSDMIRTYFVQKPHYLIKALLIEALIEQGVNEPFTIDIEGMDVEFIPAYIELPMEADGALKCIQLLRTYFENENPSFLMMCIDTLIKELYYRLPMNLEEDEADSLAVAIVLYVYDAHEDEAGKMNFLNQVQNPIGGSVELLIKTYE